MPAKQIDAHVSAGHSRSKTRSELVVSQTTTSKTTSRPSPPTVSPVNTPNATELAIWRTINSKIEDKNTIFLIVVDRQEMKSLNHFLAENKNLKSAKFKGGVDIFEPHKEVACTVMLSTPNNLQAALNAAANWKISPLGSTRRFFSNTPEFRPKALDIVVSNSIKEITYDISSRILAVNVMLSHRTRDSDMYSLCINGSSRYCGVEAWQWEYRERKLDRRLVHGERIFFHSADLLSQGSSFNPRMMDAMTPEISQEIQEKFRGLAEDGDEDETPGLSTSSGPSASADTDKGIRWVDKFLGLIAGVVGGVVGIKAGAGAAFWWFNAGGFFVKGPYGLYLSGGYFNVGWFGAAGFVGAATGAAAGLLAGAAVYYIPWGKAWNFVKDVLAAVWDKIKEYAGWIWKKIKELAADAASLLRQGCVGNAFEKFPHMRQSATSTL
ncbi:hypothetical protein BKA64DRAFT_661141 [Cadophora sp. MPI-SDFR-AT-0126]|nr:hypothetical protein BKA64DRAFT_661141 [Leotiomycetes sp. MPI-SDFR-AT-0126]